MKSIKSESMSKIRDEEEKRKETQAHFQKSINEIFSTLGKNNDENLKIKEANLDMTKKFKHLAEQYELREKQLEKLNEQIKLETQLNEAKLAKAQMEATIEKEILLKEKQAALEEVLIARKAIVGLEKREHVLKEQLHLYTDKYDEFQTSLQKSNDIFSTYKVELDKMAKRVKTLEKENYEWRVKYDKCNRALLDMVGDKQAQDAYVSKSARQLAQLQKLCRTLQAERGSLLDALKANNIERPEMPELPPEPKDIEAPPKPADKLDTMTRNCAELKATLAQLQGQMNAISLEQTKTDGETSGNKKSKKNKNKAKKEPSMVNVPPNMKNKAKKEKTSVEDAQNAEPAEASNNDKSAAKEDEAKSEEAQAVEVTAADAEAEASIETTPEVEATSAEIDQKSETNEPEKAVEEAPNDDEKPESEANPIEANQVEIISQ